MRTEVLNAKTIDEAVDLILKELKEDDDDTIGSVRHHVIYFDGWDGLGASSVLRAVGKRLSAGREFSLIIHIDCSKWKSRRTVQRALAVQLKLPVHVIRMLDAQDEEDDYRGVGQGLRLEVPKVSREIYEHVQKQLGQRFLVIFNNGSSDEIDLERFGFPLSGYSRNKALWSFQGGFRLYPRMKVNMALESKTASSTDLFLSATSSNLNEYSFSGILRCEAEEVALGMLNTGGIDWPTAAVNCFLYTMRLCGMGGHLIDYELATHGCNYWICDGIIQLQQGDAASAAAADTLWLSCDALKREMRLDADYHQSPQLPASPVVRRLQERMAYWASPAHGSTLIKNQRGRIPKGMFQQYDKLCVLKLSACTFSLTSPPFLCCHNLRFLWLDRCKEESSSSTDDSPANEEDIRRCFEKLWVLDVRYSSSKFLSKKMMDFMAQLRELFVMGQEAFDMDMLQGRLLNIRKLRVTKSKTNCSNGTCLLSGKGKMEHLELSGNGGSMKSLSVESSSCSGLETVIIDGCVSLEEISLRGWAKPNNLLLSGSFPDLCSLDLSGAAVKTLDLSAVMAPKLDELLLLDCVNLTAILWPPLPPLGEGKGKRYLGKVRIDTTPKLEYDTGSSRSPAEFGCSWYICIRDTRLLRSLEPVKDYFGDNDVHLDISTRTRMQSSSHAGSKLKAEVDKEDGYYATKEADVTTSDMLLQQQQQAGPAIIMSKCPPAPGVSSRGCYMHIEDANDVASGDNNGIITVPGFICDGIKILHVHDSLFVTRMVLPESKCDKLEWCGVEWCPKLECVFSSTTSGRLTFENLRTIWVSHLSNARYIMDFMDLEFGDRIPLLFQGITSLHVYCCPRLAHVLPLPWMSSGGLVAVDYFYTPSVPLRMSLENRVSLTDTLFERQTPRFGGSTCYPRLETLEIMWCGDLEMVSKVVESPNSSYLGRAAVLVLDKLKYLRLHELPKLYGIMSAPEHYQYIPYISARNLDTVQIKGCWSLRELPVVDRSRVVSVECEKEWWDNLPLHSKVGINYKPIHSQHYKNTMIRGSSLR